MFFPAFFNEKGDGARHYRPDWVEQLPFLKNDDAEAWRHTWLAFLTAHQDWRGLVAWVRPAPATQPARPTPEKGD